MLLEANSSRGLTLAPLRQEDSLVGPVGRSRWIGKWPAFQNYLNTNPLLLWLCKSLKKSRNVENRGHDRGVWAKSNASLTHKTKKKSFVNSNVTKVTPYLHLQNYEAIKTMKLIIMNEGTSIGAFLVLIFIPESEFFWIISLTTAAGQNSNSIVRDSTKNCYWMRTLLSGNTLLSYKCFQVS